VRCKLARPTLVGWLTDYFNADVNQTARKPYAYPAYDTFDAGSKPDEVNDGDLLAPRMLNAAPTIAAFYSLQRIRRPLRRMLSATGPPASSDHRGELACDETDETASRTCARSATEIKRSFGSRSGGVGAPMTATGRAI